MPHPESPDSLTVLYDGACPLCRREIAHVKGLADRTPGSGLCFADISSAVNTLDIDASERQTLLARFHVQRPDGSRLHGAAAFVAMWSRLPGWRFAAKLARLPGALYLMELAYLGFLRIRPGMQWLARRGEDMRRRG